MCSTDQSLVIVPTYNEAGSLPEVLRQTFAVHAALEVLVVDDSSPDGTAQLVRTHPEFGRRLHLLERDSKRGLGTAYRDGFGWALARGYWAVCEMDADLSHNPADLRALLAALHDGADLAIGSRYCDGIRVVDWAWWRLFLSLGAGVYTRALTGLSLADPTSGFKAIRRAAVAELMEDPVTADGYGFQVALHWNAERCGRNLVEVPITFTERRAGNSKLSFAVSLEAIALVHRLAWLRISGWRHPRLTQIP